MSIDEGGDGCATPDPTATADDLARAERQARAKERRQERKRIRAAAPPPVRDPVYGGLSLPDLRAVRDRLREEETRVSYWRRVIQARLDIAGSGDHGSRPVGDLSRVLTDARSSVSRLAHIDVHPVDDIEPLPNLSELWTRQVTPDDPVALRALLDDLQAAEAQLSAYRAELHRRIDLATAELIARYREQPALALTVLPRESYRA